MGKSHQKKHVAIGRCMTGCGRKYVSGGRCAACMKKNAAFQNARNHRLGLCSPWKEGGKGRPPKYKA